MPTRLVPATSKPVQRATSAAGTPSVGRYSGVKAFIWPQKIVSTRAANVKSPRIHSQESEARRNVCMAFSGFA